MTRFPICCERVGSDSSNFNVSAESVEAAAVTVNTGRGQGQFLQGNPIFHEWVPEIGPQRSHLQRSPENFPRVSIRGAIVAILPHPAVSLQVPTLIILRGSGAMDFDPQQLHVDSEEAVIENILSPNNLPLGFSILS